MPAGYGEVVELIRREHAERGSPYLVSISGGVAVGKSWTAATLQALLREGGDLAVDVVGSDGFLFSNAVLDRRGLSARKGFPETYDRAALVRFLTSVRARDPAASAPVYSHLSYDVVAGEGQPVGRPDVLIVEGLGLLGGGTNAGDGAHDEVAELFDLAIYLDAEERSLEMWFLLRFRELVNAGADDPSSFFSRFAGMDQQSIDDLASAVWRGVNAVNLHEHIEPARDHARVIIEKGPDHSVKQIRFRG